MGQNEKDIKYLKRCLELTKLGKPAAFPNPLVAALVVHNDQIIGEAYHARFGEAHAEPLAIASVLNKDLLQQATLYVNLEPCSHYGKTPPCTQLIIKNKLKRVVFCSLDPNPEVAGKGMQALKKANIEVSYGSLHEENLNINRRFFTFHILKRPYIILKWAQSANGYISDNDQKITWISNIYSKQLVHKWRSEESAILAGKNTGLHDDPQLNVRLWHGKNPVKIVICRDPEALNNKLNIFKTKSQLLIFNRKINKSQKHIQWVKIETTDFLQAMLKYLFEIQIQSLFIEGGTKTLQSFIDSKFWDEARIFNADFSIKKGIAAPKLPDPITQRQEWMISNDKLCIYRNKTIS
jgi:diaminohydroxyphosphoribosylaminopyrimidine deaminase / 5-amino-6-(5-phosphoribosylamino)uracil reductase